VFEEEIECNSKMAQGVVARWVGMWTEGEGLAMHRNRLLNVGSTLTVFEEGIEYSSKIVQGVVAIWVGMWTKAESLAMYRNHFLNGGGEPVMVK
jgi:hypothetical protein